MNECCKERKNTTCVGAIQGSPVKAMACKECKATWSELVNPGAGAKLLAAMEKIKRNPAVAQALEDYDAGRHHDKDLRDIGLIADVAVGKVKVT
ncbi:hypothetical protein KAR91_41595 [Candidatus Pacearchaeota archaeon]|nr:hypothetical protein [Candidatus Pacearchaeota archaeon]